MLNDKLQEMKKDGEEGGFTLIELMVVVLIIGILMAIAIPTFLNLTGNAKKNAAEANITTAVQDAASYFTQNGYYSTTGTSALQALQSIDTGETFVSGVPSVIGNVGVTSVSATEIVLEAKGTDNTYYFADVNNGSVTYGKSASSAVTTPTGFAATSWANLN